jgi:hypothetical protein
VLASAPPSPVQRFASILGFASGQEHRAGTPLALFGSAGYATRLGRMAAVRLVLAAVAPFVLAFLMQAFGPSTALVVITSTGFLGLLAFVEVARLQHRHRQQASRVLQPIVFRDDNDFSRP